MSLLTTIVTNENGFGYVQANDAFATLCLPLPCWSGLRWDGYPSVTREAVVRGEKVVIQAWKGACENFALLPGHPGGVGGEVGVYRRIPGCPVPREPPSQLRGSARFDPPQGPCDLWWPFQHDDTKISFDLLHPKTGELFFRAGHEHTRQRFWLSHLMIFDSYRKFESQRPDCPEPTRYRMRVQVDDFSFEW